jgi:Flp pilus assembly protein TadG
MLIMRPHIARLRRLIAEFEGDRRGVAAVEFAMLLPLMATLYLGGVEVSQAVSVDRKVSLVARAVGDLVAQGTNITSTEMTNILNAAKTVASPFPDGNLRVTVTSIKIDANKKATVEWSDALNATKRPKDQTVTVPAGLLTANTYLIWAEVEYDYTPTIGYVITGTMKLTDQLYMSPRNDKCVKRESAVTTCT